MDGWMDGLGGGGQTGRTLGAEGGLFLLFLLALLFNHGDGVGVGEGCGEEKREWLAVEFLSSPHGIEFPPWN